MPGFSVDDLEPAYAEVQQLRAASRVLSPEEKELRKKLTRLIKFLDREMRQIYDEKACSDLRRARQMLNTLNGVPVSRSPSRADETLRNDWAETRDYSKPKGRAPAPRGGVRRVVSGGAPTVGKRR